MTTILVIEENDATRHLLTMVLRTAGYHVLRVAHAPAARSALQTIRVQLIVSDGNVPSMEAVASDDTLVTEARYVSSPWVVLRTEPPRNTPGADATARWSPPFTLPVLLAMIERYVRA